MKLNEDTQIAIVYANDNEYDILKEAILNSGFLVYNHVALVSQDEAIGLSKNIKQLTINNVILPPRGIELIKEISEEVYEFKYNRLIEADTIYKQSHRREVVPRSNKRNNFKKKKR
jgi:hypothetical protein